MRNFLWGTNEEKKRSVLVGWKKICLPFGLDGFGFRRLKDVNFVLLLRYVASW